MGTNLSGKPQNAPGTSADESEIKPAARPTGHETTDVNIKGLFIFAATLLLFLLAVLGAVAVFFKGFKLLDQHLNKQVARYEPGAASVIKAAPDYQGPLLQVKPEEDLRWMHQHVEMDLSTYVWLDRSKGVVRLPIDRAMNLIVERGLPPVSPGKTLETLQRERAQPQVWGQSLRP